MNAEVRWHERTLADGSAWTLHPDLLPIFEGEASLPIARWTASGQAVVVKQGPHRTVRRVELPDLSFHLKHNHVPNWRAKFRGLVRGPKGRREFEQIRRVAERGIATSEPLGWGSLSGRSGESFLLTRTLAEVQPLHLYFLQTFRFLREPAASQARQAIATELGKFVASMHRAGIDHRDLHAGNILLRFEKGAPRLFLIDLDAVKLTGPLEGERRLQNLAMLNAWFRMHVERSDRLRFWKAYALADGFLPWKRHGHDAISLAKDLEQRSAAYSFALWRSRETRCLGNNRYYQCIEGANERGHAVRGWDPAWIDASLAEAEGKLVWTVFESAKKALQAWKVSQAFRERGLPTSPPVAVLVERDGAKGRLLVERMSAASTASEVLASADSAERRQGIRRLANAYRDLHDRGLIWLTPKLERIAVHAENGWKYLEPLSLFPRVRTGLWFTALEEMRLVREVSDTSRQCDVARLASSVAASRTDCLRFLRQYLRPGLHSPDDWKTWWRNIADYRTASAVREK